MKNSSPKNLSVQFEMPEEAFSVEIVIGKVTIPGKCADAAGPLLATEEDQNSADRGSVAVILGARQGIARKSKNTCHGHRPPSLGGSARKT